MFVIVRCFFIRGFSWKSLEKTRAGKVNAFGFVRIKSSTFLRLSSMLKVNYENRLLLWSYQICVSDVFLFDRTTLTPEALNIPLGREAFNFGVFVDVYYYVFHKTDENIIIMISERKGKVVWKSILTLRQNQDVWRVVIKRDVSRYR